MPSILSPLANNVPIVDPATGHPTPYFQRMLQQWLKENGVTDGLATGAVQQSDLAALVLDDLADADTTTTAPADGQALVYDDASGLWVPGDVASSGGAVFSGARITNSAAITPATGATTDLTTGMNTVVFDAGGYTNLGTNPGRMTVPSAGYYTATFTLRRSANVADQLIANIRHYNSAGVLQRTYYGSDVESAGGDTSTAVTGAVSCSAGDYFVPAYFVTTAGNLDAGEQLFSLFKVGGASQLGSMELIQETTISVATNTVTFSSIPSTYRDLMVRVRGRSTRASTSSPIFIRFNNDTTGSYDTASIRNLNTTVSAFTHVASTTGNYIGDIAGNTAPAGVADYCEALVYDYRGTTFHKAGCKRNSYKTANAAGGLAQDTGSIWWRSTAAINRVDVLDTVANFAVGTVISLYGIM